MGMRRRSRFVPLGLHAGPALARRVGMGVIGLGARAVLLAAAWVCLTGAVVGDAVARRAEEARDAYRRGDYQEALRLYRDAQVHRPDSPQLHYNVGGALFKTKDAEAAAQEFEHAAAASTGRARARALYNLGNAQLQRQQAGAAVEAYRGALQLDPKDADAKANLELALKLLQQQQQQQQQQRGGKGQPQDDRRQQDRQPQPSDQDQQAQSQQQDQQQADTAEQHLQERRAAPKPLQQQEAERLLDALRDREKQAQMRRLRVREGERGNDW